MKALDTPLLSSLKSLRASPLRMRHILEELSRILHADGSWSRAEIFQAGEFLMDRKNALSIKGLWPSPPLMITTTLDDAVGQGLAIIHLFSRLAGVDVKPLGLMQPPEKIIDACRQALPDILGMTILQFHSEETLCDIMNNLPSRTRVIVGGPIFKAMSPQELKKKGYLVLNHINQFIDYLLTYPDTQ
jgi:methylmalonyl-CoA mutase cobalamin-binding subunit